MINYIVDDLDALLDRLKCALHGIVNTDCTAS
jgi:hypothetical protein